MTNENDYQERIKEYSEEVEIIDRLITGHKKKGKDITREPDKAEHDLKIHNLILEKKTKTARLGQLKELMKKAEATFKAELKHMKENWHKILEQANNQRDKLKHDHKLILDGIKKQAMAKSWVSPKHKLQAYKTLMSIVNENSNGKSI